MSKLKPITITYISNFAQDKLRKNLDRSILITNAIEHFCTSLYSFVAPLIAKDFFPAHDYIVGLILTYSVCLTSVISRPFGSIIFGFFAIKESPVIGLRVSLFFISCLTILISLIPSYEEMGFLSPLFLVILVFLKGIFASGESAIAKLLLLEGKEKRESFKSSYNYQFSSMLGIIFASFCASMIFIYELPRYSWRILFLCSGLILLFAMFLRFNSNEIGILKKHDELEKINRENIINFLQITLTTGMSHITYIIPFVLLNNLMPEISKVTFADMMSFNTALLILDMLMIPVVGRFLERYEPQKIILISLIVMLLSIPLMMLFLQDSNIYYIIFFRIWVVFWGVVFMCPQNIYYKSLFPHNSKYLVVGLANAIGSATIGKGSTPFALYCWHVSSNMTLVALYFGLIIFMNILVIIMGNKKYSSA
jgi:MFS family permease